MGARIVAIANQKGGVGKTTTALSLGAALARAGSRVLMLDLDPHVCASIHMRLYPEEQDVTLFHLFQPDSFGKAGAARRADLWGRAVQRPSGQNWAAVCGDTRLAELEADLRDRPGKGMILRRALEEQREHYDYIMVDCPPQMGVLLVNALVAADLLIIPIQTDFLALHGLKLLFDTLRTLNKALPQPVSYMTLATMFDKRANACKRVLELLERKVGSAMFETIVPMDTRFREASALGKVIYDVDPASRGAQAYTRLAMEVMRLC